MPGPDIPFPSVGRKEITGYDSVEYIDDGKRVVIPAEVWEALKEIAEHAEIHELVQLRKDRAAVHSLDGILAEEGPSRADLEG